MYPVGTRLKVIDADFGARGANGTIAIVTDSSTVMERITGRTSETDNFIIRVVESGPQRWAKVGEYWAVGTEGEYEVLPPPGQHLYEIFLPKEG